MRKNYTTISLSDLNAVRAMAHRYKPPGYHIRTFFLGPRVDVGGSRARSTTRDNAVAAKLAVYAGRKLVSYI